MFHPKHHELSFDDIDIERIFQPSESLNFIKNFRGNNDFDAAGGMGLVEAPDSLISTEPPKQKEVDNFQNCSRTTPIQLKNELSESHKPISILHCSVKDDKCPQTPPSHFSFESDKPVADIPFKASSSAKKRKIATGQHFENNFLSLFQAMEKTKK